MTEQAQMIGRMQALSSAWQEKLDSAVRIKDDEIRAKQEEVRNIIFPLFVSTRTHYVIIRSIP